MGGISRVILVLGTIIGLADETLAGDSVPGGWDAQVGGQPFSETNLVAYPVVGRVGAYGYGVIPGSKSVFARESSPDGLDLPGSIAAASRVETIYQLPPLLKTVRRSTSKGRRFGR